MWLSFAFFIGALNVIQGLHFSDTPNIFAHHDPCVAKILSCDYYRQSFSLHKEKDIGFFTNLEDLNKACNHQTAYMRCMARAEKFCKQTIFLPIAQKMIKNRRFPADVCRPPSPWQQLYLREASCLNAHSRKAFVHCIHKTIGIGNLNPDNSCLKLGCKYGIAIIDCSATTLQEKCGYYAGDILKRFLKFHSLSDYKCIDFEVDDVEDNSLSSMPNYDIIEAIFNILEKQISHNEPTEIIDSMTNTDFEEIKVDVLENYVSDDPLSEESVFAFNHVAADELLKTTEDPFSDSFNFNAKSEDITIEPDKFDFPPLPKRHYIHKNRTTFALYADLEMGHMKYIGCGEADVFWVMLSPLRSKYCILTDLKSEYSESIFTCTVHIGAPCSPELNDEGGNRKAEVFHHMYVVTVLTAPNNQRLEDMAVMNVHYLKVYPSSSKESYPKKINLCIDQANKFTIKETESVNRKGALEKEDDYNNVPYKHGNGSGQKRDTDTLMYPHDLDEDEYSEEYDDWYYNPTGEDDDKIYFSELLNGVIYIEDDNGDLISLHDPRSPIYSNSLYQPHSQFRPRIGAMPASTDSWKFDEDGTNRKNKLFPGSIFEERIPVFKDGTSCSKVNRDQQGYCFAEAPCPPNSETISKFGIKPGMYMDLRNVKILDQFKGLNQKMYRQIQFSRKLNDGIDAEPYVGSRETYVVTPSAEIEFPKSTESRLPEKRYNDEFVETSTHRFRGSFEEDDCDNIIDTADDSRYLDPEYSSTVTSAPDSADSKIDYRESISEYYNYEFTQSPYAYLSKYPNTIMNLKSTIDPEDSGAESLSENELLSESVGIFIEFLQVLLEIIVLTYN